MLVRQAQPLLIPPAHPATPPPSLGDAALGLHFPLRLSCRLRLLHICQSLLQPPHVVVRAAAPAGGGAGPGQRPGEGRAGAGGMAGRRAHRGATRAGQQGMPLAQVLLHASIAGLQGRQPLSSLPVPHRKMSLCLARRWLGVVMASPALQHSSACSKRSSCTRRRPWANTKHSIVLSGRPSQERYGLETPAWAARIAAPLLFHPASPPICHGRARHCPARAALQAQPTLMQFSARLPHTRASVGRCRTYLQGWRPLGSVYNMARAQRAGASLPKRAAPVFLSAFAVTSHGIAGAQSPPGVTLLCRLVLPLLEQPVCLVL